MSKAKKLAVILCGSGFKDGSEIRESVFTLLSLSQRNIEFQCFAPDKLQADVINCLSGMPMENEKRNMLVEAARIARGHVLPLDQLKAIDYDGIILPGGFGAAKNLCNFASKGSTGETLPELSSVLREFHQSNRPIGAICIAPAIVALVFKDHKLTLTVGAPCEVSMEIEKTGNIHETCAVNKCVVDLKHKVVTTPAYMYGDASMADIFKGIDELVKNVIELT